MPAILIVQTLLPAVVAALVSLVERVNARAWVDRPEWVRQLAIGVLFGLLSVFATETGLHVVDGGVINVRDAAPVVASLAFGAPAGVIAGVIGAVERWFCVLWGGGMTTRLASSLATLFAGVGTAALRKFVFDDNTPLMGYALAIGITSEVLHMLLILVTNMAILPLAFEYVRVCSNYMIILNGVATGLALLGRGYINHDLLRVRPPHLITDLGFRLFMIVGASFLFATVFTFRVSHQLIDSQVSDSMQGSDIAEAMLYMTVFMEILVNTALFILLFQLLRKRVVDNIEDVGTALGSIAEGNLETEVNVRDYQEFSALSDDVNTTVRVLRNYISEAEHRRDTELELARQIQHSALPSVFPPFPDRGDFDLFASMNAAKEVGGDFYDFFLLNSHTLVFLVADVSGKGVPAALFMMKAKTEIHALMESGMEPDVAFTEVNARLCEANDLSMFVTAWLGKLDLSTGSLTYANAGHNPALLRRANGEYEYLRVQRPNLFLAGMETTRYRKGRMTLGPGDKVFLYTDGVTEAMAANEDMFGEERLLDTLNGHGLAAPRETCEGVVGAVREFATGAEQSDDITVLSVDLRALRGRDRICTQANVESIDLVREFFAERLPKLGADPRVANRVQVAVDEAYSNICRYGNATSAVATIMRKGADLMVEFADDGIEFDPTEVASPDITLAVEDRPIGGLGIHMMRKMSKSMEYIRAVDTNILTLIFEL